MNPVVTVPLRFVLTFSTATFADGGKSFLRLLYKKKRRQSENISHTRQPLLPCTVKHIFCKKLSKTFSTIVCKQKTKKYSYRETLKHLRNCRITKVSSSKTIFYFNGLGIGQSYLFTCFLSIKDSRFSKTLILGTKSLKLLQCSEV